MQIKSLRLRNFRRYSDHCFEFSSGVNGICGPNAAGKTTILEALYLLVCGHSFRTQHLSELIRHGENSFLIEGRFEKHGITQRLAIAYSKERFKITHNSSESSSWSSLFGVLSGVAMVPDDAALVKGSPQVRRRYLDLQIAQSDPLYVHYAKRYQRALKQRNALLKRRSVAAIDSWEEEMATAAAYISHQRGQLTEALAIEASEYYRTLGGEGEELSLAYVPTVLGGLGRQRYLLQFQQLRQKELQLGHTVKGPHKDDLSIAIGGRQLRHFGSEGQQRSSIVALRLSEWQLLKKKVGAAPLMFLDDIGISLDEGRTSRLYSLLGSLGQVMMTTTEESSVVECNQLIKIDL